MATHLASTLGMRLLERGDRPVLTIYNGSETGQNQVLTGEALYAAATRRAATLAASFDPAAGPLALAMPTGVDVVITLLGGLFADFTMVLLSPPRGDAQAARFDTIIHDCRPVAILCSERPTLRRIAAALGEAPTIPVLDIAELPDGAETVAPVARPAAGRPAIIQYTSGSTRRPRGVLLTGDNVIANMAVANRTYGLDQDGLLVNWLPLFHDLGLIGGIMSPLLAGAETVLMDPLHAIQRPHRWLRAISDYRATVSGSPAFMFAHCLRSVRDDQCEGLDLSSWISAFCGAEPVPVALMTGFRDRFARYGLSPHAVYAAYGLAEHTLMIGGGPTDQPPAPPQGCDAVEPCRLSDEMAGQVRIVDPETSRPVDDGEQGEIWVRGRSVATGYLNDPSETEATFGGVIAVHEQDGRWLRTGDLAALADGHLYVTGRLKDLLFVNGRKVPAPEVEWLAAEQEPALNAMAAAAIMPDDMANGKAVLLIELKRHMTVAEPDTVCDRIRQAVLGASSIDLVDIQFRSPGSLPRTTSGKIQRRAIAQAYRDGAYDATAA